MDTRLTYPVQVLVPENGVCELVRIITAIHAACIDAGGAFFGVEFTENELQDFFDTHPHCYFEVKPRGAIGTAVKEMTKAVLDSLKKGSLKLEVTRVNFENDEVCLLNSWVAFSAFEEWCESRSIELAESWFDLYKNEQTIAQAASEEGESYRRMLEGQSDIEEIKEEFKGQNMDLLLAEISSLRAKQKKADAKFLHGEKPLGTRERDTLLTIIAVLAKAAKVDLDNYRKPGKAAGYIEGLTDDFGAHVSKRTIEDHLKKIPDALTTRKK